MYRNTKEKDIVESILMSYEKFKSQIEAIDKTVKKIALNPKLPLFYAYELINFNSKRKCLFIDLILMIDTTLSKLPFEKKYILENLKEETMVVCGVLNISERTYFRHKLTAINSFRKALVVDEEQLRSLLRGEEWIWSDKERNYNAKKISVEIVEKPCNNLEQIREYFSKN